MINPGSIAREGYLTSVLSIAVSGYLGGVGDSLSITMDDFNVRFTGTVVAPFIDPPPQNWSVCERSGFRALPGELVYDEYTRQKVLPEFADIGDLNHRKFMSTDTKKGPLRPEKEDRFIDTPVDPDDF